MVYSLCGGFKSPSAESSFGTNKYITSLVPLQGLSNLAVNSLRNELERKESLDLSMYHLRNIMYLEFFGLFPSPYNILVPVLTTPVSFFLLRVGAYL